MHFVDFAFLVTYFGMIMHNMSDVLPGNLQQEWAALIFDYRDRPNQLFAERFFYSREFKKIRDYINAYVRAGHSAATLVNMPVRSSERALDLLYDRQHITQLLIAMGADKLTPNPQGKTPLHYAIMRADFKSLHWLLTDQRPEQGYCNALLVSLVEACLMMYKQSTSLSQNRSLALKMVSLLVAQPRSPELSEAKYWGLDLSKDKNTYCVLQAISDQFENALYDLDDQLVSFILSHGSNVSPTRINQGLDMLGQVIQKHALDRCPDSRQKSQHIMSALKKAQARHLFDLGCSSPLMLHSGPLDSRSQVDCITSRSTPRSRKIVPLP